MTDLINSIAVTLSEDLMATLRTEAERLGLPLEWIVASLVVDTLEGGPAGGPAAVA